METDLKTVCAGMEMPAGVLEEFLRLFEKFKAGPALVDDWDSIHSPGEGVLADYDQLALPGAEAAVRNLSRLVVLKLNGGLGTSMGCEGPKSCMVAKNGKTFLDLIFEQMRVLQERAVVPLVLMNSFYTHEETARVIRELEKSVTVTTFQQNRFPRLDTATHLPAFPDPSQEDAWYPPGHGDLFGCLRQQGLLDRWLQEGREILFASNSDNLGAVVDERILHLMLERDIPFLMELTPKTPVDVKGGTVYQRDGKLGLLEIGNVPDEFLDEFRGMNKFRVFNTNNIWIHLRHLKERLQQGPLDLGFVANQKVVRGRKVLQLETAMGAGLGNFENSLGLVVPRTRFAPVKNTSDLLRVRSDVYNESGGKLILNPERAITTLPEIILRGPLENAAELDRRVRVAPGMLGLDTLEVEGDVTFLGKVELKGRVKIVSNDGSLEIEGGQVLEDKVLSR
ncbi:MAG: UTP--glucose-1-phosphate uridylyltransferase [Nitrospina sp.]|nr:UTP--glucose-1-phosphate uridylyltransferase [Nitrospina sp.]